MLAMRPAILAPALLCVLSLLAAPCPVGAQQAGDIAEVVSTGQSWNTFTNRDGTGLYHEIVPS